jgi:protocatechuate 3,4-dioxygenase beta subunit
MRRVTLLALLAFAGSALGADSTQYQFNFIVKVGDGKATTVSGTFPPASTHRLPAAGHLVFEIETPQGTEQWPATSVRLIDDSSGTPVERTNWRDGRPAAQERAYTFTVCGERVIVLNPSPATPPSCAGLPPMAKPDPVVGRCSDCTGPYEGMPETFASRARIAPVGEPGEPLVLSGRVLGPNGKPSPQIIVYAYHTNAQGIYPPPNPPRSTASNHHGQLRGWAQTDADGRYEFDTIRPAGYPGGEPQHIHMHVIEPGCGTYVIDEVLFSDDPRLTPQLRERMSPGRGGKAIVTPQRDANGTWQVVRDIRLGENIPQYTGCPAPSAAQG